MWLRVVDYALWRLVNEWCKTNRATMMDGFHPPNEMNVAVWIWPQWMNFHGMNVVHYTNMTTSIWDEILWIKVNFTSITKIYGWILWSWRRETVVNFNCWVNFIHYASPHQFTQHEPNGHFFWWIACIHQ